mmetsp:Transcript_6445/g.14073  ORF Transcript_6445/g.14073 Transcript_6445/m.14073 type:complete len:107 (-) Transcript_6445:23-343(-)
MERAALRDTEGSFACASVGAFAERSHDPPPAMLARHRQQNCTTPRRTTIDLAGGRASSPVAPLTEKDNILLSNSRPSFAVLIKFISPEYPSRFASLQVAFFGDGRT